MDELVVRVGGERTPREAIAAIYAELAKGIGKPAGIGVGISEGRGGHDG